MQPNGTTCGQTVVAMVTGIPVEESIAHFGHNKGTNFKEQTKILNKLGMVVGEYKRIDNRKKWEFDLPNMACVRLQPNKRQTGHIIAYQNGIFYDPLVTRPFYSKQEVLDHYNRNKHSGIKWRFSHYYEVSEPNVTK